MFPANFIDDSCATDFNVSEDHPEGVMHCDFDTLERFLDNAFSILTPSWSQRFRWGSFNNNRQKQIKFRHLKGHPWTGLVVNFYPTTNTILFQGAPPLPGMVTRQLLAFVSRLEHDVDMAVPTTRSRMRELDSTPSPDSVLDTNQVDEYRPQYPPAPFRPVEPVVVREQTHERVRRPATARRANVSGLRHLLHLTLMLLCLFSCAGNYAEEAQLEATMCLGKRFSSDITDDGPGSNAVITAPTHNTRAQVAAQVAAQERNSRNALMPVGHTHAMTTRALSNQGLDNRPPPSSLDLMQHMHVPSPVIIGGNDTFAFSPHRRTPLSHTDWPALSPTADNSALLNNDCASSVDTLERSPAMSETVSHTPVEIGSQPSFGSMLPEFDSPHFIDAHIDVCGVEPITLTHRCDPSAAVNVVTTDASDSHGLSRSRAYDTYEKSSTCTANAMECSA